MTDSELHSQYAGYSDQQLAEFIASGIPDWQAEQFRRLLMLRRREHYLGQIVDVQKYKELIRQIPYLENPLKSAIEEFQGLKQKQNKQGDIFK